MKNPVGFFQFLPDIHADFKSLEAKTDIPPEFQDHKY